MQKKQATKLEQLKQTSKQAKKAQKQEEQQKQPKDFKQAKELKHLKQDVIRCLRYIVCLPTPNTYQRSPLLNNDTSQQSNRFVVWILNDVSHGF